MRTTIEMLARSLPGVLLCAGLAVAGNAVVAVLRLPIPGPVLGLVAYLCWLLSGRGIAWSRPGALLLIRWIGAMIVPALVGLQLYAGALAAAAVPLALLLVATTLLTALATAGLYRLAGGE